jgi:hypothetical protein
MSGIEPQHKATLAREQHARFHGSAAFDSGQYAQPGNGPRAIRISSGDGTMAGADARCELDGEMH